MHHTHMSRRAGKILDFEFSITNIHKNIRVPDMYITCQNFRTLKFWTFYFGRLIFGHFLSHFGHISDQNFRHFAETWRR